MPHPDASRHIDRYSVVIPPGTRGPVGISVAVYYQSIEAIVALKFLGNMADTNGNNILEPCALGGLCDGRKPTVEPAVVEGSPAVPMIVSNWVISIDGSPPDHTLPAVSTYPASAAADVYSDVVVKAFFSKPVRGVNASTFTLSDSHGARVPAMVDQIGDGAWGLFPNEIVLKAGETYTARLEHGVCDAAGKCTSKDLIWRFRVHPEDSPGMGDTSIPIGFRVVPAPPPTQNVSQLRNTKKPNIREEQLR
jgi:hypothetical protein